MIKPVVVDASVVVAELLEGRLSFAPEQEVVLLAPSLLPYEVTNVLRKLWDGAAFSAVQERNTVALLKRLPVLYWPWDAIADRVWEHRHNLTSTDASYVAVAELANAILITKDRKLAAAPGIRCAVEVLP